MTGGWPPLQELDDLLEGLQVKLQLSEPLDLQEREMLQRLKAFRAYKVTRWGPQDRRAVYKRMVCCQQAAS